MKGHYFEPCVNCGSCVICSQGGFVGIELSPDYRQIAEGRVTRAVPVWVTP